MTILYALLVLFVAVLVTTITPAYDITIELFNSHKCSHFRISHLIVVILSINCCSCNPSYVLMCVPVLCVEQLCCPHKHPLPCMYVSVSHENTM